MCDYKRHSCVQHFNKRQMVVGVPAGTCIASPQFQTIPWYEFTLILLYNQYELNPHQISNLLCALRLLEKNRLLEIWI